MSRLDKSCLKNDHCYDLAVIGAGPAGALASALASDAGLSTVLLEKKKSSRPKICGGFISRRSLSLLPAEIGLQNYPARIIYSLSVNIKKQKYDYQSDQALGLLIKREIFDQLLRDYACSRGTNLYEGIKPAKLEKTSYSGQRPYKIVLSGNNLPGDILHARYLIGADGAMGSSGRISGLRKKRVPTGWGVVKLSEFYTESPGKDNLSFYPLPMLGGMGWSFCGPDWINRGVGGLVRRKNLLQAYQNLFPEENKEKTLSAWPLPFLGPLRKAAFENIMLVGDAAGLVEPFSGEGIFNALLSAILAVNAIRKAETRGCFAEQFYRESFNYYFRNNFLANLAGATLLHALSFTAPSRLPEKIAALMNNGLWFNRTMATNLSFVNHSSL